MTAEVQETTKKSKKERSKKRKLENVEDKNVQDEELIVKDKKKAKKAKKNKEEAQENDRDVVDQATRENVEDDDETRESPGSKTKEPSKRKIKKEKAELRAAIAKESSKQETAQKALNYVSMWKHARDQWKFNKVKQIWLIDNLLHEKYVPDEHYSTILEYFEASKGLARQKLIDKAMKVIKKVEDSVEDNEELVETTEYKRARQLLQALPNET